VISSPSTGIGSRPYKLGACLGIIGLAGLAAALLGPGWRLPGIGIAFICFLAAASLLSNAAQIASPLRSLVDRSVRVEVWGQPIEGTDTLTVHAVRAIGAGLHIYLSSPLWESPRDLKIAQPSAAQLRGTQLTINKATYISLAGTKLPSRADQPALHASWPPR
jgi:hypothetical protein